MTTKSDPREKPDDAGSAPLGKDFDPSAFDPNNYTWLRVVAMRGESGEAWVEAFRATPLPDLIERCDQALFALRRGRREKGREILDEVRREVDRLETERPEWPVVVVRRWLHGTEAYLHYLEQDFEAALAALAEAEAAVRGALEMDDLLLPLAYQSLDFMVQRMRVARNERRWPELDREVERARAMVDDRRPLFELEDGREVFSRTVVDFYRACRLSDEERRVLEYFYSDGRPVKRFEATIARLAQPAGFVVPYH